MTSTYYNRSFHRNLNLTYLAVFSVVWSAEISGIFLLVMVKGMGF